MRRARDRLQRNGRGMLVLVVLAAGIARGAVTLLWSRRAMRS
ncbi:hypothetical protein [Bradyrhizobium frederickii]|nr:hypothetical protein [Bradyrhizobium frederickii]